ncbi:MAG: hypothetical protein AB8C95_07895 [Phycisphaeraceae bacterium]
MSDTPPEHEPPQEAVTRADHHGSGVEHPIDDMKKKRPLLRALIRITVVLMLLAAILIALAPTLISTGPGTRWLVSLISNQTPGELTVDDLQLSWFGGQRIDGVHYDDSAQGLAVQLDTIDAQDVGLFGLLRGDRHFGEVRFIGGQIVCTVQESADDSLSEMDPRDATQQAESFKLPSGLSGTFIVKDTTVQVVAKDAEPVVLTFVEESIEFTDIRDISVDITATLKQGQATGQIELMGNVLNLFDPDGIEQAEQAAYDLKFVLDDVPTKALDQIVSGLTKGIVPGQLVGLLGDGQLLSRASIKGTIEELKSDLSISTPKLRVVLDQRTEGGKLIASPESYAKLDLDQAGFLALFPKSGLKLVEPTPIDLASLEMALPILGKAVDWDRATASLLLKAGANLAVVDERGEVLGIDGLRITGSSDSIADKLSFKLTTTLSAVDSDSQVTREAVVVDLIIREPMQPTRQIDFFSEALPIQLADALMGEDGRLVLWLGKMLALQADLSGKVVTDGQGTTTIEQQFSLRPEGRVNGVVSGSFSRGKFMLATPAGEPIEALLVPEAFASLMEILSGKPGQPALTIDKPMPVYLTLRDQKQSPISITTRRDKLGLEGFFPDPDATSFGATIVLSPARVFDPKLNKTYELRGGSVFFSAPDLRGEVQVQAELDLWVRPNAGDDGVASLLTWQTTVTDLLDSEGSVPLDSKSLMQQIGVRGGMKLENAPSGLMDSLLNRDGDLASILGPIVQQMDASFSYQDGQATGASVRLNWDDKNNQPLPDSWASMKPAAFDIDDQQMLTVRGGQNLELEIRVSQDFGDRWMGKLHPILFDAKSGDRPVKIKIDGKSFRFPMKGDKMLGSRVEASVDLGTIEFGNDALLGKLMGWTKRPGERAVFEPAKISLIDGKLSYDQFDLTVGKVKLRLDGEVDIATGQIVDMAVRVPGDSLIRVFNELDGVIKPDDYLSIPMTGAIRKPTFDSNLIGREVARLVTRGLLDQQKKELGDLIRKGIGGDKPKPGDEQKEPVDQPEKDPAQEVADELLNRGLDLLFKRLGRDKDKPKQE